MKRHPRTRTESQLHLHPFAVVFLAGLALVMSMADSPFTLPVQAQQDFNKVQIKATRVTDHVYMLEGSGGNIGVSIGAEGIVIVDDQFAPLAPKIKQALKNIADQPVRFVLNTHFHGDHSGGNPEFGKEATIIAHENVRKRLQQGTTPMVRGGLPVITFNDRASVHLNDEEIRAIHLPHGHTDGDSAIWFQDSNVVHMGDDFVTYGFPFVDVASGGSVSGMIAGCEKVLSMVPKNVKIIPGHGPLSGRADMEKFIAMLKETRALVANAAKEGKAPEQMKADNLLAQYADLGKGFITADKWIDTLVADLKGRPSEAPAAK